MKLKLEHSFSQIILRFKICKICKDLKDVDLRLYFELFPNSQKGRKLGFLIVALVELANFSQFVKENENWDF